MQQRIPYICTAHHASQTFSPTLIESGVEQTHTSGDSGLGYNNKGTQTSGSSEPGSSPLGLDSSGSLPS